MAALCDGIWQVMGLETWWKKLYFVDRASRYHSC